MSRYSCSLCGCDMDYYRCIPPGGGTFTFESHVSEADIVACVKRYGPKPGTHRELVPKPRHLHLVSDLVSSTS